MVKVSLMPMVLLPAFATDSVPSHQFAKLVNQIHSGKKFHQAAKKPNEVTSECWHRVNRRTGFSLEQNPGAGLDSIEPFDRVLKDGMLKVACAKDSLYYYGDKFGGNKHDYRLGDTANVSIVRYEDHVLKEDRQQMTPKVCFNFCRTIDDMSYFGIMNGRECYCEPYYKPLASDSTDCDSVCAGDSTQLCGGESKSSIWEMHYCNDGAQQLAVAAVTAYAVQEHLDDLIPRAIEAANGKQALAAELQDLFGQAGDPGATKLMQMAKVSAGNLLHTAEDAEQIRNELQSQIIDSRSLTGIAPSELNYNDALEGNNLLSVMKNLVPGNMAAQFMDFEVSKKGDELTQSLQVLTPKANKTLDDLQNLYLLSEPMINPYFYVHQGSCVVDEDGCVQSRTDQNGKYLYGDWCWIEVLGGEIELSVEKFDLNVYSYKRKSYEYNAPTAWLFTYNPVEGTWNDYGGNPSPALNNVWWQSQTDLEEKNRFHSGFIGWYTWYWGQRKTGWKFCGLNKDEAAEEERGIQYYPAMYFVDKQYRDAPMTCTGDLIEQPIYFKNYHGCAKACDARVQECVGFSYFPTGNNKPNLCFLFSRFASGQYYTGCDGQSLASSAGGPPQKRASFLQKGNSNETGALDQPLADEPTYPVCVAKLSKFVGTSLKPNPEGKCKQCFKELTPADRCWH